MTFKRRRFLMLASLGGLGMAVVASPAGKMLWSQAKTAQDAEKTNPKAEFATPKGTPNLRFIATADSGSGDRNQFAVGRAIENYHRSNPFTHAILGGDNIYNSGEMSRIGVAFEEPYAAVLKRGVTFRAAIGNHDIRTENADPQVKYAGFNMEGRYYTYQQGPAQFFVLDTNTNADWKQQMSWLERELAASQVSWKIVYGHHPIYSSGLYNTNPEFVQRFTPLFKKYRVNLYINGHEHHYERTQPIDGTTYLITGHGGASLRSVGKSAWTEFAVSRFGFSAIELWEDQLVIQGIGTNGTVFDRGRVARVVQPV